MHVSRKMKPSIPVEPQFLDGESDVIVSLPAFVTRTSLQSILHANGVKTLEELETRITTRKMGEPVASEIHEPK
jgi:hypothetical protein